MGDKYFNRIIEDIGKIHDDAALRRNGDSVDDDVTQLPEKEGGNWGARGQVAEKQYAYYRLKVNKFENKLKLSVTATKGNVDMFLHSGCKPDLNTNHFKTVGQRRKEITISAGNPKFKGGFLYIGILGNSATSSFVLKISLLSTAEQAGGQEAKSVKTALAARLKLLSSEKSVALAHCQVVEDIVSKRQARMERIRKRMASSSSSLSPAAASSSAARSVTRAAAASATPMYIPEAVTTSSQNSQAPSQPDISSDTPSSSLAPRPPTAPFSGTSSHRPATQPHTSRHRRQHGSQTDRVRPTTQYATVRRRGGPGNKTKDLTSLVAKRRNWVERHTFFAPDSGKRGGYTVTEESYLRHKTAATETTTLSNEAMRLSTRNVGMLALIDKTAALKMLSNPVNSTRRFKPSAEMDSSAQTVADTMGERRIDPSRWLGGVWMRTGDNTPLVSPVQYDSTSYNQKLVFGYTFSETHRAPTTGAVKRRVRRRNKREDVDTQSTSKPVAGNLTLNLGAKNASSTNSDSKQSGDSSDINVEVVGLHAPEIQTKMPAHCVVVLSRLQSSPAWRDIVKFSDLPLTLKERVAQLLRVGTQEKERMDAAVDKLEMAVTDKVLRKGVLEFTNTIADSHNERTPSSCAMGQTPRYTNALDSDPLAEQWKEEQRQFRTINDLSKLSGELATDLQNLATKMEQINSQELAPSAVSKIRVVSSSPSGGGVQQETGDAETPAEPEEGSPEVVTYEFDPADDDMAALYGLPEWREVVPDEPKEDEKSAKDWESEDGQREPTLEDIAAAKAAARRSELNSRRSRAYELFCEMKVERQMEWEKIPKRPMMKVLKTGRLHSTFACMCESI